MSRDELVKGIKPKGNKPWTRPTKAVKFNREDGEYMVQMTFSEVVNQTCQMKFIATNVKDSEILKIKNKCTVGISNFSFDGSYCDANVEAINHKFTISYSTSKYCKFTLAEVTMPDIVQTFNLPMSEQTNYEFQITQDN